MGARALLLDSDPARHFGRRDRTACAQDDVAGAARRVPPSSTNRAMDVAAMDVRIGNGCDRLLHAVSIIHAGLFAGCATGRGRSGDFAELKKRRAVRENRPA